MRLTIKRLDAGGSLPLLSEVPSHDVCRIEGYNGIGKSLTVRLLMLCSGAQPYGGQQALWDGFRGGIGRVEVTVSELADNRSVSWRLNSQELPADIDADGRHPRSEWFESIEIDGQPAQLGDAAALFEVKQIRANEGLLETLADDLDGAAGDVQVFHRLVDDQGRLDEVELRTTKLLRLLSRIDPSEVLRRRDEVTRAAQELTDAKLGVTRASELVRTCEQASDLASRAEKLAHDRPTLKEQLGSVENEIEQAKASREQLQNELEILETRYVQGQEAKAAIATARTTQKRESTRFTNASEKLADALQTAGLSELTLAEKAKDDVEGQIEALEAQRLELDATPAIVALNADLGRRLKTADLDGLGAQLIADLSGRRYSVREIDEGLRTRATALEAAPSSPSTLELDRRIKDAKDRLEVLTALPRLSEAVAEARRRKLGADERLANLTETSNAEDVAQMKKLRDESTDIDEKVFNLSTHRVVLKRQLEELGTPQQVQAARGQLDELLAVLETDSGKLEMKRIEAHQEHGVAKERFNAATESLNEAEASASRSDAEFSDVLKELQNEPSLAWLRRAAAQHFPTPQDGLAQQLSCVLALTRLTEAIDRRIRKFRQSLRSARVALNAEADSLRGGQPTASEFRGSASRWAQERADEWFAEESVRRVLIGDVSDVTVSLDRRAVSWSDGEGVEHAIPLQGFSSGQAVFAYTEAQLLRLGREVSASKNRLIVIDEFGAFVARNRLDELRTTLLTWQRSHPSDQIVLILPLSQDYQALAATAVGSRAEELEGIVAALKNQGYYTESFVA